MYIEDATYEYYSHWTGLKLDSQKKGYFINYNPDRDIIPKGYSNSMDIYVFAANDLLVISYGNKAKTKIEDVNDKINGNESIEFINLLLKNVFLTNVNRNIKYIFRNKKENTGKITVLNSDHWELYIEFYKENHPNNEDYSWVKEYFGEMVEKKYCHGIILDNKLVSATDTPDMAYMCESVQEIGINTLKEYRGKGYAREACISLIHELLSRNICPLWSTTMENAASDRLAKSIGFEKLADVLSVSIQDR
jgi:hypothetical protein